MMHFPISCQFYFVWLAIKTEVNNTERIIVLILFITVTFHPFYSDQLQVFVVANIFLRISNWALYSFHEDKLFLFNCLYAVNVSYLSLWCFTEQECMIFFSTHRLNSWPLGKFNQCFLSIKPCHVGQFSDENSEL